MFILKTTHNKIVSERQLEIETLTNNLHLAKKSVGLLTKANTELEKKVQNFTKKCAEKDEEITRLTELLQNQSPDEERKKILDQIALIDDEIKLAELRNPVRQRDYKANLQFIDRKRKERKGLEEKL